MTHEDIERLLASILPLEQKPLDRPSVDDWHRLVSKFGCNFDNSFRAFVELMSTYQFPGDIYNVSTGSTNGNDLVQDVFDLEMQTYQWNENMIPFYGIGNGDYFCFNRNECPASHIYYYYGDRGSFELYCLSFDEWLLALPKFLE